MLGIQRGWFVGAEKLVFEEVYLCKDVFLLTMRTQVHDLLVFIGAE